MSYTTNYKQENAQAKKLRKQAGEWLKGLRKDADLTQNELAQRIGYQYYTFISQIECGEARVPVTDYAMWANALGMEAAEFAKQLLKYYDPHTFATIFGRDR